MKVTESAMSAIKALDCTPASLSTSGSMVIEAVESLGGGRAGLSLQSIKKYIAENHVVVDQNKQDALTRKAVKKLVDEGKLIQVKGTGASGSFKLAAAAKKKPAVVERKKPAKKAVLKIKITSGRSPPAKSSRKSLSRKTEASKKAERPKADTEKKLKKTIPKKSTDLKGSSKTTSKPAAKKQSSKKK